MIGIHSGNGPGEKRQAQDDDAGAASGPGLGVGYSRRAGFSLLGTAEPVLGELTVVLRVPEEHGDLRVVIIGLGGRVNQS